MKRKLFLPTLFTFIGLGVLCMLGTWQLQRLEWKEDMLAKLDAEYAKDAAHYEVTPVDFKEDFTFRRGFLRGRFLKGKNLFVEPRTLNGRTGRHFYTPFRLTSGAVVFVNKGWVPVDFDLLFDDGSQGIVTVKGILKKPPLPGIFTPANRPDKNEWYYADPAAMAKALNLVPVLENYVFVVEENNVSYPVPVADDLRPNNNHLQYAVFWFMMAGVLFLVYVLRFLRKP